MLKRHQESRASHIDRIRKNMPSASSPRNQMPIAGSEEVMRLKNELAIQRALRLQRNQAQRNGYRPSAAALNEYTPLKHVGSPPPTERHSSHKKINLSEMYQPSSARNIVSVEALKELRQMVL